MKRMASGRVGNVKVDGRWLVLSEPSEDDTMPDMIVRVRAKDVLFVCQGSNALEPDVRGLRVYLTGGACLDYSNMLVDTFAEAMREAEANDV